MKVLRYGNRKIDDILIDISTPEKESAGYLYLFKVLKDEWMVYGELAEDLRTSSRPQRTLYIGALHGSAEDAKKLMKIRRNYEYESVWELDVIDPLISVEVEEE